MQLMPVAYPEGPAEPKLALDLAPTVFRSTAKRRDEVTLEICESLIDIVSALFSVPSKELRKSGRTPVPVSRVRQIAMYVAHVVLRLTMGDVGLGFGRDRTTVLYACHVIEDMRDDPDFDHVVSVIEQVVFAVFRGRLGL